MLTIQPYPGDEALLQLLDTSNAPLVYRVWEEPVPCVVLGRGNREQEELHIPTITERNVPVYRREGGGGSVVLSPGMLIIAVAAHVTDIFGSKRFFRLIQTPIQEALGHVGIEGVRQRGISDLAYGERKILGSSMRRKGTILLYQAVLLVDVQREIFGELLQHPPKEPDYRQGRDHDSFTVTLRELGFSGSISSVQDAILHQFDTRLHTLLAEELV